MFGDVWRWAGVWREREMNVGIAPWQIATAVADLCAAASAQTADREHPAWPTCRFCADLLATVVGRPVSGWRAVDLADGATVRQRYLDALRHVDQTHEIGLLTDFARS
jgi:hypothetical protein